MTGYLVYGVFCLLIKEARSTVTSQKVIYKDLLQAPTSSSKVDAIRPVPTLLHCTLHCSKRNECKALVHDGETCYLYNSSFGSERLNPGEKAIAEISKEETHGN